MKFLARHYGMLLLLAGLLNNGCSVNQGNYHASGNPSLPSPSPTLTNSTFQLSAIRKIDFSNFDYPLTKNVRITLRDGKHKGNAASGDYPVILSHLRYGDVTRDGSDEALIVLFENVKGSAVPYYVFVYSTSGGSTKLLWSFETGDRADGGLRQVYAQNGDLVIELYGKGTSIGGKLYGTEEAACCPRFFSKTRYEWSNGHFRKSGEVKILPNPTTGAAVIMPAYRTN